MNTDHPTTSDVDDIPLVSIITPVLNRRGSIETSLASVSAQSYPRLEHIVVDGGSTDGTLEVVSRFRSKRLLRSISEPDRGMYDAINKGLRLAKGQIIGYLNSDDIYLPWSVEIAVKALREEIDLIYGDLAVMVERGGEATGFHIQFYRPFNMNYYTHVGALGQPTVFWKRGVTEKVGDFDTSYRLIADCEYWLRAFSSGARIEHVDEILAIQVEHGGTLRATQPQMLKEEFARLREVYGGNSAPASFRLARLRQSLRWRLYQLRFRRTAKSAQPRRWPRFIGFLKKEQIEIKRSGIALFLLPARLRPSWSAWLDTSDFRRKLLFRIGVVTRRGSACKILCLFLPGMK